MQPQTNNIIDLIINSVTISQFIGQYIQLSSRGANYLGLCPFHSEKSPSFTVNNDKKFFHCFGCKESGNVIQFAMKYHNLKFKEALEKVASFAGISLDQNTYKKLSAREILIKELTDLNNQVALVYHQELKTGNLKATGYIKYRNISPLLINQFMIGGSPTNYPFLAKKIDLRVFHERVLNTSQLFYKNNTDSPNEYINDRFRDKIIFPIQNIRGDVIAFGSRVLDDSLPKYINSPETPLFKKRETLYGIFQAKETIKEKKAVYITEGYFDVIAMHQQGYKNTVATLGTAITQQHIKILKNLSENIILLLDGDIAGEKAALKALFICLGEEITPQIVLSENGKDPYDMAMHYKENLNQWLVTQTKTWEDFLIYTIQKETNPIQQQKNVKFYLQNLEKINPFLSQSFAEKLGDYFHIPINTFLNQEHQHIHKNYTKNFSKPQYKEKTISYEQKEKTTEEMFVCLAIYSPNDFYFFQKDLHLSSSFFTTLKAKELFSLFLSEQAFILEDFILKIPSDLKILLEFYKDSILSIENKSKALLDCYYSLQIVSVSQQEKSLKEKLKTLSEQEDIILTLQELEIINKKKKNFEVKIRNHS